MKNIIKQYYNMQNLKNYKEYTNEIVFNNNEDQYILRPILNEKIVYYIYQLSNNYNLYDKIIKNVDNKIYTNINGTNYILIKKKYNNIDISSEIVNKKYFIRKDSLLDRSNWVFLWSQKLDYYEFQQKHIKVYSFITESFNYYLGMGETAISYIKYNLKNQQIPLVVSHKRITEDSFFDPLNIVVDYRARDISQYLKYLFLNNKYRNFNFDSLFNKLNFSRDDYLLLYGRLFFPCFYFDLYDEIINNNLEQKKILEIISRSKEYEQYINMIYSKINKFVNIPKVDWL